MQTFACHHDTGLHHLFIELAHCRQHSVLGITPASLLLSAFTITMNSIVSLRWVQIPVTGFWAIAEPRPLWI